ncbi:flavoprotein-like protein [Chaetomium strumarium]|uniref:Flavoprotein-like protein n=1 Tax=Chaetomium strumarium TaxID=1170767 RepID=A0AAJ0GVY4_9PEZI|nr:flavoprotein-like protein [Chaetomium strumarium]
MAQKAIGVIVCSTRPNRINPSVAKYVLDIMETVPQAADGTVRLELIDLADQHLPLYDEPAVPGHLPAGDPTPHYVHAHSRDWSTTVRRFDAFVFVTPQYNWSVPASLKNALDYLFHEWKGKPAGIVTYGHRGGEKAAAHLVTILAGLRMGGVVEPKVALRIVKAETDPGAVGSAARALWLEDGADRTIRAMAEQLSQRCLAEE